MVQAPIRVVLADDTADIRMLLRASLEIDGRFEVVGEAGDGREAVDMTLAHMPDVVVLDLAMPVMDGLQAIAPITEGSPASKIVILSGFDAAEMAGEAMGRGAHAYLEKGASAPQVIETLLGVLDRDLVEVEAAPPVTGASRAPVFTEIERPPDVAAEVDEVLAALVHELMTPLTVIQGFSDTINQRLDLLSPEMIREASMSISRNAEQMANLITSFADARRMEVESPDLYLEHVDLGEFVRQTVSDLSHITTGRPVELVAAEGIEAKFDKTRIRQVLQNLVTNAVKYTPEGSPIEVELERSGDTACIAVSDHGPGIPDEQRERVFSKFTRLDDREKGAGLGLYIARSIARAHGGDVTVEQRPTGGATFTLKVPVLG